MAMRYLVIFFSLSHELTVGAFMSMVKKRNVYCASAMSCEAYSNVMTKLRYSAVFSGSSGSALSSAVGRSDSEHGTVDGLAFVNPSRSATIFT